MIEEVFIKANIQTVYWYDNTGISSGREERYVHCYRATLLGGSKLSIPVPAVAVYWGTDSSLSMWGLAMML